MKLQIDPLRNEKYFLGVSERILSPFLRSANARNAAAKCFALEGAALCFNPFLHRLLPFQKYVSIASRQVDDLRAVPCLVFKCAGFVITRAGTEAIPDDM